MCDRTRFALMLFLAGGLLLAACSTTIQSSPGENRTPEAEITQPAPEIEIEPPTDDGRQESAATAEKPTQLPIEPAEPEAIATLESGGMPENPVIEDRPPSGASLEFKTDFSKHSIQYSEILSGGPPKDGIPPVDDPKFYNVPQADEELEEIEPVVLVKVGDQARAYPLRILTWHEIINDTVGDLPLVVTFCPLCNTAIAFERTFDGQVLDFGTTGRLRYSNLIMYDRQTETWWQQATGEGIAGELTGKQLAFYPATIISWEEFRTAFPDGDVLSSETGFNRSYGRNPYTGYDSVNNTPFLYSGPKTPGALPAMARVLTVDLGEDAVAYPYQVLEEVQVVNDTVAGEEIVVFWAPGTASALDTGIISAGRDVGSAVSFSRALDGQVLTFTFDGENIIDEQTGSVWDHMGRAVSGELAGEQLIPVVSINHFWFSWAAFRPETQVYQP